MDFKVKKLELICEENLIDFKDSIKKVVTKLNDRALEVEVQYVPVVGKEGISYTALILGRG